VVTDTYELVVNAGRGASAAYAKRLGWLAHHTHLKYMLILYIIFLNTLMWNRLCRVSLTRDTEKARGGIDQEGTVK
jgi:hypothetical protein